MLPTEDSIWVGRRAAAPLRPAVLAGGDDRDRRQPLRHPPRPPAHRPPADPRLQLVLPRHGRRDDHHHQRWRARRPSPATSARRSIPPLTTKVVEFNDLAALKKALAPGDVACVLAEPALTNIGIVLPDAGYHEALRELTRETGTLLVIDETHTICAGPGGYTRAWGLEPDMLTIGKPIASGVPAAVYGFTARGGRPHPRQHRTRTPPTPAASAARWPATRSPSRPCARRWRRSSRTRPSST